MKKLFFLTALLCASVMAFAYSENEKFPANGTYKEQFSWSSIDGVTPPMGVNSVESKEGHDCIYVNVGQADFDRESGIIGCEAITDEGAGVWIKISSLTKKRNIIYFKNSSGVTLRGLVLRNEKGADDPESEYCAYEGSETEWGGNYVTLTWTTLDNGNVEITLANGTGATSCSFRNGGFEGGVDAFLVSSDNFVTADSAKNYFTATKVFSGNTFTLTKIADLPANSKIKHVGRLNDTDKNAFSWTVNGDDAYRFADFVYTYGSVCTEEPVLTNIYVTASAQYGKVGDAVTLTTRAVDQFGMQMDVEIDYDIDPSDVGNLVGNTFTFSKLGAVTITASSAAVSGTITLNCVPSNNLAEGKFCKGGYYDNNPAEKDSAAVDGNASTAWVTYANQPASVEWLYVDLEDIYDITGIDLLWGKDYSTNYILQVRTEAPTAEDRANDAAWDTIATVSSATASSEVFTSVVGTGRYVRFRSLSRSAECIRLREFRVFGTEWIDDSDTQKPVMESAELDSKTWNTVVIAVSASDNVGVDKYRAVDASKSINVILVPHDDKITITGLSSATPYNFTITALDNGENESDNNKVVSVTTESNVPTTAAPTPSKVSTLVMSLYSDIYDFAPSSLNSYNEGWWDKPNMTEETIGENHYLHYDLYREGMIGCQFAQIDVSEMEKIHIDIYASKAGSVKFRPITVGGPNNPQTLNLEAYTWNSFDLALSLYEGHDWEKLFQYAIEGYKDGGLVGEHISVDNVYLYKDSSATALDNTEAEVKAIKVIENGQLVIIKNGVKYNVAGQQVK